jgi:predicted  nucleic acid-binding Zn-ribbon protein
MASRKQDAFNRSMATLIGAAGVNVFLERMDERHELTDKVLQAQENLIESQWKTVDYLKELVLELHERVEALETKVADLEAQVKEHSLGVSS